MKQLLPALLTCAILSALATAGLLEVLRDDDARTADVTASPSLESPSSTQSEQGSSDAAVSLSGEGTDQRIHGLEDRVAELERRLVASSARVEVEQAEEAAAIDPADPMARKLVLDVLAEEEAREQAEREVRRAEQQLASMTRRADRIGDEIGLGQGQRTELVEVLLAVDEQRDAARDAIRDGGFEDIRETFRAVDAYKSDELARRFGESLAQQIEEADSSRWGRGDRGNRGDNNGGGF